MRRLLLTLLLLPILGAAHGATALISATILTLFVLPALYLYVARHPRLAKALH